MRDSDRVALPPCDEEATCFASKCEQIRLIQDDIHCVKGRCVLDVRCVVDAITCNRTPPDCEEEEVPVLNEEGDCWTDVCVVSDQCIDC